MSSDEEGFHQNREKFIVERASEPQAGKGNVEFFGPALPPHLLVKRTSANDEGKKEMYGPILADSVQGGKEVEYVVGGCHSEKPMIGPEMPEHLKSSSHWDAEANVEEEEREAADEQDESYGPSTNLMATEMEANYCRSLSKPSFVAKEGSESNVEREEWMTQLPEKKKAGVGCFARKFKTRLQTDKESDSSVWTDTPANKNKKDKRKDDKAILEMKRLKERDKEMEKLAKKAEKLRKKKSLLEIHLKKKKKKKKEAKEKKEDAPERRPFDRNIDLQIRRIDESKRRAILSKTQFLNDRFAPGQSKFL